MPAIVSDWDLPLSEPQRYKVAPRLAIVLSASGLFSPVLNPETQLVTFFESRWHYAWTEPVRFRVLPKHSISLAASGLYAPVLNPEIQLIAFFESRWHQPWSEPVRLFLKRGIKAWYQQFFTAPSRFLPKANITMTIAALDASNANDRADVEVWVHDDPAIPIDLTAVNVSVIEVADGSSGNISIKESE